MSKKYLIYLFITALVLPFGSISAANRAESIAAATTIGKWLSRVTSHYDFLSATPVAVKRAGTQFMIIKHPPKQFASDYGFSYMQAKFSNEILQAYSTLDYNTAQFPTALALNRIHLNFGMENSYDLTFSYGYSQDGVHSYGIGFKRQLIRLQIFSLAYRIQLTQASQSNIFKLYSLSNDISMGLYFKLIDFYAGIKHYCGSIDFYSDISALKIPRINFFANTQELDYFYGVVIAPTYRIRVTLQLDKQQSETIISAKLSLHFYSLLPSLHYWLKDPRYIRF